MTKKITKAAMTEFVQRKLRTDAAWAKKALFRIYNRQTENEKKLRETNEHNGVGFNGCHAFILTELVNHYNKNKFFSSKQMRIVFKLISKYHRQIIEIADNEKLNREYLNDPTNLQTKLDFKNSIIDDLDYETGMYK